uniref:Uncharacterized protein n=1 Tax=Araneus ventricosus TaxID=182803 RepID=A0A4Y2PMS5_ARAVE|nr:hypothetical protein AVEN_258987-1 [Araneus ventricosus]
MFTATPPKIRMSIPQIHPTERIHKLPTAFKIKIPTRETPTTVKIPTSLFTAPPLKMRMPIPKIPLTGRIRAPPFPPEMRIPTKATPTTMRIPTSRKI